METTNNACPESVRSLYEMGSGDKFCNENGKLKGIVVNHFKIIIFKHAENYIW
jgi:hypothetical protein